VIELHYFSGQSVCSMVTTTDPSPGQIMTHDDPLKSGPE